MTDAAPDENVTPPPGDTPGEGKGKAKETAKDGAAVNGVPWRPLFFMAVALVVAYFLFAFLSFARADDTSITEPLWSRSVFVLLGVQSIAFTAIGWLFGREVHSGEAQIAKNQANDAKGDAQAAHDKADTAKNTEADARERAAAAETAGQSLAAAVRALADQSSNVDGGDENAPAGGDSGGLPMLKSLADRLFP